jgi:hypothetical protein
MDPDLITNYTNAYDTVKNALVKLTTSQQNSIFFDNENVEHFYVNDKSDTPLEMLIFLKKYNLDVNVVKNVYKKFELRPSFINNQEKQERIQVLNGMLAILNDEYKNFANSSNGAKVKDEYKKFSKTDITKDDDLDAFKFLLQRIINLLIFEVNPSSSCPTMNPSYGPNANIVKNLNMYIPQVPANELNIKIKDNPDLQFTPKYNLSVSDIRDAAINFNLHPSRLSVNEIELRLQFLEVTKQAIDTSLINVIRDNNAYKDMLDKDGLKNLHLLAQRIIELFILETTLCKPTVITATTTATTAQTISKATQETNNGSLSSTTITIIVVVIVMLLLSMSSGVFMFMK